jgi:S-disulfanyl-L-cysteine oxidoreductase SoxD
MCSWVEHVALVVLLVTAGACAAAETRFGLGRTATLAEIAAWDIDVRPDGHGVRAGRGSVAQGQDVYDAQCATCHGTFGESNLYMVIAGGVRPEDLKTGRAAGLRSPDVERTLGNKLNYVTTLWDYIYRAMPWSAPQSLAVNDVYAVTAYVLYLNEIVPADFVLDDQNLLTLKMPNRDGLTRAHGLGRVDGTTDVQGGRCMRDCAPAAVVTSRLPEYALGQHGQLREQFRSLGPFGAVDSLRNEPHSAVAKADAPRQAPASARDILARRACTTCHGLDRKVVGPAFAEVGARYRERQEAGDALMEKIRKGTVGAWGAVPMPAQGAIRDDELQTVVRWLILGAP